MMAEYQDWNQGVIRYVTGGLALGRPAFLHVDEEVLIAIGATLSTPVAPQQAQGDFLDAVRREVCPRGVVDLMRVRGSTSAGEPLCVGFLAATVLAATWMGEDEAVSEANYFVRLHEVLGLQPAWGRPTGYHRGVEEPLWQQWNRWLQLSGWLPTAFPGEGAYRYIQYPISQALLRRADVERLRRLFQARRPRSEWDPQSLASALLHEPTGLSSHLRMLLSRDGERWEAACEAIYEIYVSDTSGRDEPGPQLGRALRAELLRFQESWGERAVRYHYYPRAIRAVESAEGICVVMEGEEKPLRRERPGWFEPVGTVLPADLARGVEFEIRGALSVPTMRLPARSFWILVRDPDDPESSLHASWGPPQVGDSFILLIRESLLPQLERLASEDLLEWAGEPVNIGSGWLELRRCVVLAEAWGAVFVEEQGLIDALAPRTSVGLRISGGVRVPDHSGWLDGYAPDVAVSGFGETAALRLIAVETEETLFEDVLPLGSVHRLPWPGPGTYRIEAYAGSGRARRMVKIHPWDVLRAAVPADVECTRLPDALVKGALVLPVSGDERL